MSYLERLFGLEGKTVVLTGGGGVLATHMAEALLRAGAAVSLWGVHAESVQATVDRLRAATGASGRLGAETVDTSSESSVTEAMRATLARFGDIDVLLNGVGGNRGKCRFVDVKVELFKEVLVLNLVAGFLVPTKIIAAYWLERKQGGSIINMASMGSYVPLSGVWAYDAAKAGVLNLTMATAKELAVHHIRVNAIAPGFFLGKQNRSLLLDEKSGELTQRGTDVLGRTPCGRFGEPEELAGAVLFLASAEASGFVTGACIPVDGGFLVDCL